MQTAAPPKSRPLSQIYARQFARAGWIMAALAILVGFLWLSLAASPFVIDDAFISFRYAENLVHGNGLVFNPGEHVEGYTNFLWVVLLAGVNALGGDSLLWAKLIGTAANLTTLAIVGTAAWRWWPQPALPGLYLIPPLLLAANFGFVLWGVGGLETALFNCFVTGGLIGLVGATPREQAALAGETTSGEEAVRHTSRFRRAIDNFGWALLFALAVLTRPDAVVLFMGGISGWLLWAAVHRMLTRVLLARLLIGAALFFSVLGAHTLFRYLYYGDWVPNTVYIKAPMETAFDMHWTYLLDWLRSWGVLDTPAIAEGLNWTLGLLFAPGVWLVVLGLWRGRRYAWAWVLGASVAAWLVYLARVYNDWMPGWRYYTPILPACVLLIAAGLNQLASSAKGIRNQGIRRVAELGLLGLVACLVSFSLGEFKNHMPVVQGHAAIQQIYREVGEALRVHAPPNSSLVLTDAGAIPYYSGLYTIDYAGLTDKHMARIPYRPATVDKGDGVVRHYDAMRYDTDYVLGKQPDFVHLNGTILPDGRMVIRYPEYGQLYQAMKAQGTYDLENPVFYKEGNMIVRRKGTDWRP